MTEVTCFPHTVWSWGWHPHTSAWWLFALMSWHLCWTGREQWLRSMFCLSTKWETYHLWSLPNDLQALPNRKPSQSLSLLMVGGSVVWHITFRYFFMFSFLNILLFLLFLLLIFSLLPPSSRFPPSHSYPPSLLLLLWPPPLSYTAQIWCRQNCHHWQMEMYFSFCNVKMANPKTFTVGAHGYFPCDLY